MASEKIVALSKHHQTVLQGEPWYGTSFKDGIKEITAKQAISRTSGQHNIAEILFHMSQWKKFALEKVKGNIEFNIKFRTIEDWKTIDELDEKSWQDIQQEFIQDSEALIEAATNQQDSLLSSTVPGRSYNYENLLQGITEHDIYHLGQIMILKKIYQHEI